MAFTFPIVLGNLFTGPIRWVYAPTTVALPVKLDDVCGLAAPYTLKTGWLEGGALTDDPSYSRGMDSSELKVQQRTTPVLKKITGTNRQMTVSVAEITPELTKIIEVSSGIITIAQGAAASGTPAQSRVPFGSISTLPRFRHVMIGERDPGLGTSGEGGARGQLLGVCLYSASVEAADSEMQFGVEDLVGREVSFDAYPDPSISAAADAHGCFLFETGATVP